MALDTFNPYPIPGVILDTETLLGIPFGSFEPPRKSRSPVYDDIPVRGRSEPHVFYSHTGPQIYSFSIHLVPLLDNLGPSGAAGDAFGLFGSITGPALLKAQEAFLESLVLPSYKGDNVQPPHLARIAILKMFDVIGTVRDIDFTYQLPYQAAGNPLHGHSPIPTGYPYQIDVNFTFHSQTVILDKLDQIDDNENIYAKTLLGEESKFI